MMPLYARQSLALPVSRSNSNSVHTLARQEPSRSRISMPFVKHIFTPNWLNDWLSPTYTAYCVSQFPKQDGYMYSNSDTYQTIIENYLVRFRQTLGFGLKLQRYYCNFRYKHTYVNKVPAWLDYVSQLKELTNDFWFQTGHQQRSREWKSSVCLTDHPAPASAPHGVLALFLTSSLQLLLLTTATRGCRVSTNVIWVMISWLHLRPIWSFFRWGQAAGCTPICCVTRQLVQKVEQPKQSSLNRQHLRQHKNSLRYVECIAAIVHRTNIGAKQ